MTRSLQDLSRELIALAEEHLCRNVDALGAMSRCRSIQELFALQSELLRDNLQQTLESTRRVAEVSTRMSSEATRTMARQANAQQRAA
jgi:phasin family protein